jgi:hypothetical protein
MCIKLGDESLTGTSVNALLDSKPSRKGTSAPTVSVVKRHGLFWTMIHKVNKPFTTCHKGLVESEQLLPNGHILYIAINQIDKCLKLANFPL